MKVLYQFSVAVLAGAIVAASHTASAQGARSDRQRDVRPLRLPPVVQEGRWERDDDRRGPRYDVQPGRRRGQDAEWLRRQRAQREEWCRRHRNDRRCDDVFRRRDGANWCWDVNRDRRCDGFDNRRRDSRSGVYRNDRGPQWERWLSANGVDVNALIRQPR
jgi:hypothetical protein